MFGSHSQEGSMIGTYCTADGAVLTVNNVGPQVKPSTGTCLYQFGPKGLGSQVPVENFGSLHYLGAYTLQELKAGKVERTEPLKLRVYAVFALGSPAGERVATNMICTYAHVFSREK